MIWLTASGLSILGMLNRDCLRGKRHYAMLTTLPGCDLKRPGLSAFSLRELQRREEHLPLASLAPRSSRELQKKQRRNAVSEASLLTASGERTRGFATRQLSSWICFSLIGSFYSGLPISQRCPSGSTTEP